MEALPTTGHTRYRLQLSKKGGVAQWKLYVPLGTQDIGNSYQRMVESLNGSFTYHWTHKIEVTVIKEGWSRSVEALLTTGHTR